MNKPCIDLKATFGKRFKIEVDECAGMTPGRNNDPWNWIIPGPFGHIYPHGGTRLGAATNGRGGRARALVALLCVQIEQEGSDGYNLTFDVADFEQVAQVLKLRKRRYLSIEHRQRLREAGQEALRSWRKSNSECDSGTRNGPSETEGMENPIDTRPLKNSRDFSPIELRQKELF